MPKVIDFGMSFRRVDKSYLRGLGGSLLWVAPEIVENPDQISEEVLFNPYPSDVYSLGVVLAEVLVDGEVPDSVTAEYIICLKYQGESPIDLTCVGSDDISFKERILDRLKDLVGSCCCVNRDLRISLSEVFTTVDDVYEELCQFSFGLPAATRQINNDPYELNDRQFIQCQGYKDMLDTSRMRFPSVRKHLLLRPSRNPVMDEDCNLLVHHFCKLDFTEGVQYLVEKSTWGFQAERDIPYMSLECVRGGSTGTLRYLATSWPEIMREQLLLVHEACKYCDDDHDGQDLLQVLLNVGIDFETWEYFDKPNGSLDLLLPIQKLAIWGKKYMLRTLLEYCELHPERVSNRVFDVDLAEAVFLSVKADQIETMDLLLEGKRLKVVDDILNLKDYDLHSRLEPFNPKRSYCTTLFGALFAIAVNPDSFLKLNVAIALLERDYGNSLDGSHVMLEQKRRLASAPKHLKVLKNFVAGLACSPSKDPVMAACRKGNEEVIDAIFWLMAPLGGLASRGASSVPIVVHDIVFRIASHGSKLMVDIIRCHGVRFCPYQHVSGSAFTRDSELMEVIRLGNHKKLTLLDVSYIYNNKEITDYLLLQPPRVTSVLMRTLGDTHPEKLLEPDKGSKKPASIDHDKISSAKILVLLEAYGLNLDRLVLTLQAVARHHWSQADALCQEGHWQSSVSMVNKSPQVGRPKLSPWTEKARYEHLLHSAAYDGKVHIVNYLLKRGFPVDLTIKDWYNGSTALFRACVSRVISREQKEAMARTLLEAGANPNHKNAGGYTAMDVVLGSSDGWRHLFHLLVQGGFNLGDLNHAGESYMSLALREFGQPRE